MKTRSLCGAGASSHSGSGRPVSGARHAGYRSEAGENNRTVMVQFDSLEEARAAYASPAYQEALAALGDGAVRDLRIIEAA